MFRIVKVALSVCRDLKALRPRSYFPLLTRIIITKPRKDFVGIFSLKEEYLSTVFVASYFHTKEIIGLTKVRKFEKLAQEFNSLCDN